MKPYELGRAATNLRIQAYKRSLTATQLDTQFKDEISHLVEEGIEGVGKLGRLDRLKFFLGTYQLLTYTGFFGLPTIEAYLAQNYMTKIYTKQRHERFYEQYGDLDICIEAPHAPGERTRVTKLSLRKNGFKKEIDFFQLGD